MSTFLELVNDLERESGTIHQGGRLATVIDAPGRQEKMVEWIVEAWRMIQLARADWPWRRGEFEGVLTPGQARYTPAQLGITTFAGWVKPTPDHDPFTIHDPAIGRKEEQALRVIGWPQFKAVWDRGVHDSNRPCNVSIASDLRLCFGPTPDKAYAVRGEYVRSAQVLAANDDVPLCPADHHHVILWRAVMLMGDHDEAPAVVSTATAKFQRAYRDLVDASLPEVSL